MRLRLYLEGHVDIDAPGLDGGEIIVENGEIRPAHPDVDAESFDLFVAMYLLDAIPQAEREKYSLEPLSWSPVCRVCGCTEDEACEGGCSWSEPDLCTSCISKQPATAATPRLWRPGDPI